MTSLPPDSPNPRYPSETFNARVRRFWEWFEEMAPSFRAAIEAGNCHTLDKVTNGGVDPMSSGFGWVYGPGEGNEGHSFTLTGEGVEHHQLLARQWLLLAPQIEGWTFHASRQPGPLKGQLIEIHGHRIDPREIWVTPSIDEDRERVDLTLWHPLWDEIDKKDQWQIALLFLDEALGEYGVGLWIGEIRLEKDRLADSFPLEELRHFIEETSETEGWKKFPPGAGHTLFKVHPLADKFPRGDLMTLSTAAPRLFRDHREARGRLEDPLKGTGADYVYVSVPKSFLPKGQEVTKRGDIEDALGAALEPQASGRCIGGGMGTRLFYVDLLIFDGARSLDLIVETLRALDLPEGTAIEYFAREKAANRILL